MRTRDEELARLIEENTILRGLLGSSALPCPYCGLPAEEQSKCPSGFPGCGRADDQMLYRRAAELWDREQLEARLEKSEKDLRDMLRHSLQLQLAALQLARVAMKIKELRDLCDYQEMYRQIDEGAKATEEVVKLASSAVGIKGEGYEDR